MVQKVDIRDLARYTILRLIQNGNTICPLKLQKVLYYMQAWHLVYFERENTLFEDIPEAWVNGPVYRQIYDTYRHIGIYDQISLQDVNSTEGTLSEDISQLKDKLNLSQTQYEFIESILRHYGTMSHDRLVFLTHSQKPWNDARIGLEPFEYTDQKISLDNMYNYYSKSIKK